MPTSSLKDIKSALQSGQFEPAHVRISAALQQNDLTDSDTHELLYLNAVALRYLNKLTAAFDATKQLLALQPNNGRAYQEQAYCLLASKDIKGALMAFHKAVEYNPALIASWQQIVTLFKAQQHQNYQPALNQFNLLKALPAPVLGAMDLMHEGKLYKAEQVCRNFLQKNRHQVDAMCLLAEIGLKLKVYDDAEFLLESCVDLYPDNEHAKALYVNILNRLGKFKQGAQHAEEFLAQFDAQPALVITVKATLANCYINLGELTRGQEIYQAILAQSPERNGIHVQLGHAHKTAGNYDLAVAAYQQAYNQKSDYGDAYWSLANIKTYQFSDDELAQMQQVLSQEGVNVDDRVHINFSLGKAFEDRKEFSRAFDFYQQGNALKKQSIGYDAEKSTALIDQQIKHCTKALFEQRSNVGNSAADPIFILGLPRAGSTLLEQIIASHSQVDGTMELHNILGTALKLRGRIVNDEPQYPKNLSELSDHQLKQLGDNFMRDTQPYRQNAPFFIDKMPNNFIHIGLIKLILPNAKIIDARREPMACCFSGFKQLFGEGQDFSYGLSDIATYYQDYLRLMDHWDQVMPGAVLRVQHEELVHDFERQVRRILDYCQLPFEQSCLEFYNTKRNIYTPSAQQVRQPISTKGLTQWQNFEPYLGELKATLES